MKYLSYGDSIEDGFDGLGAEMLVTNDKVSARDLNRPSLNLYENSEEVYNILQSAIKTIYGNKNGIVPDVYEEFNAKNIFMGGFGSLIKYIRVPTGLAYLSDISVGDIGGDSGIPYDSSDGLTSASYQADKFHSLSIMNRPNTSLFERELASLINLDMTDLNNDIKIYDSIGSSGLMRYRAAINIETSSGSLSTTYLPNISENTKFNVYIPSSSSKRYIGIRIYNDSGIIEENGVDSNGALDSANALQIDAGTGPGIIASNIAVWINNSMKSVSCERKLFNYPNYYYEKNGASYYTNYIGYQNRPSTLGLYIKSGDDYILADGTYKFGDGNTYYTYDENKNQYDEYTYSSPNSINNTSINDIGIPTTSESYSNGVEIKCTSDESETTNEYNIKIFVFSSDGTEVDDTIIYERIKNEDQRYYNSMFSMVNAFTSMFSSSLTAQTSAIGDLVSLEPIIPINSIVSEGTSDYVLFYNKNYSTLDSSRYQSIITNTFCLGKTLPTTSGYIQISTVRLKYSPGTYSIDYDGTETTPPIYDRKTITTKEADLNKLVVDTKTELFNSLKFANHSSGDTISIDASDKNDTLLSVKAPYTLLSTLGTGDASSSDGSSFISIGSTASSSAKTNAGTNKIIISNDSDTESNLVLLNSISTIQSNNYPQFNIQSKANSNPAAMMFLGASSTGTMVSRGALEFDKDGTLSVKGFPGGTSATFLTINGSGKIPGTTSTTGKVGTVYFNLVGSAETFNIGHPYTSASEAGTRFNYVVGSTGEFGHLQISGRNTSQHSDSYSGALDLNNQNIYGASSIYIAPYSNSTNSNTNNQTVNFSIADGTSTYADTIYSDKKNLYFIVGRSYGSTPNTSIETSTDDSSKGYCQLILGSTYATVRNLCVNGTSKFIKGATFTSDVGIKGGLSVTGNATFAGTSTMSGNSTVGGTLGVTESATFAKDVLVAGSVSSTVGLSTSGSLTIGGDSTFVGTITYKANISASDYSAYPTSLKKSTENVIMINGRCAYANFLTGETAGSLPYQSGFMKTSFLTPPTSDDMFLSYSTGSTAITWISAANMSAGSVKKALTVSTSNSYTPSSFTFDGGTARELCIPDQALGTQCSVNFTSVTAGTLATSSKRSLKKNIKEFKKSALDIINGVDVVSFNYKTEGRDADAHVGFIADDTDELLSGKAHDSMQLSNCIGILIKAIQELSSKVK